MEIVLALIFLAIYILFCGWWIKARWGINKRSNSRKDYNKANGNMEIKNKKARL